MKSKFMRLNGTDGIKIALNFLIGTFVVTVGESLLNGSLPGCFADLMVILKGSAFIAITSTARRFFTNSTGQIVTTEATPVK